MNQRNKTKSFNFPIIALVYVLTTTPGMILRADSGCIPVITSADLKGANYAGEPKTLKEIDLVDGGKKSYAVVREYRYWVDDNDRESGSVRTFDVVLTKDDGKKFRINLQFADLLFEDAEARQIAPGQEELFVVGHPRSGDGGGFHVFWLALLNTKSCEWVAIPVSDRYQDTEWETKSSVHMNDPRFKLEAAYLKSQKHSYGPMQDAR